MKKFLAIFTAFSMAFAFVGCESETTVDPAVTPDGDAVDADHIEAGHEGEATTPAGEAPAGDATAPAPAPVEETAPVTE